MARLGHRRFSGQMVHLDHEPQAKRQLNVQMTHLDHEPQAGRQLSVQMTHLDRALPGPGPGSQRAILGFGSAPRSGDPATRRTAR